MKKTYINPALLITKVNVHHMISASANNLLFFETEADQDLGMDVKRSTYSIWNDDWSQSE